MQPLAERRHVARDAGLQEPRGGRIELQAAPARMTLKRLDLLGIGKRMQAIDG